jgi:hypothetical protein
VLREFHAFGGEPVEVRCRKSLLAVAAQIAIAEVVRENEHDVGPGAGEKGGSQQEREQKKAQAGAEERCQGVKRIMPPKSLWPKHGVIILLGDRTDKRKHAINYRVANLDRMIEQLRSGGVAVEKVKDYDYGRFTWVIDPEGTRIELWEPKAK